MRFLEIPGYFHTIACDHGKMGEGGNYRSLESKSVNCLALSGECFSKQKTIGLGEHAVKDEFCVGSSALWWFQMPVFLVLLETEDASGKSHGKLLSFRIP